MATLRQLSGRLRRVELRLNRGIEQLIGTVGDEVGKALVPATPVDTGFARGNWRPTLNVPASRPVTFLDPTGAATIARIKAVSQSFRLGDILFIVNNAPYIGLLNAGRSPQASAGFVAASVEKGVNVALLSFQGGVIRAGRF